VLPKQVQFRERFEGAIDYILLYLDADWVAAVAQEALDPDHIEILPHFPQPDPFIYQTGLLLKSAVEVQGSFNQLYGETLALALSVHLLQHYAGRKASRKLALKVVLISSMGKRWRWRWSSICCNITLAEKRSENWRRSPLFPHLALIWRRSLTIFRSTAIAISA